MDVGLGKSWQDARRSGTVEFSNKERSIEIKKHEGDAEPGRPKASRRKRKASAQSRNGRFVWRY